MRKKRGMTTVEVIIAFVLGILIFIIIGFIARDLGFNPLNWTGNKFNIETRCTDLYRQNNLLVIGSSNVKTCQGSLDPSGCPEEKVCCDIIPDDNIKDGDKNFFGCCIPKELQDTLCPKPKTAQKKTLSGAKSTS